MARAGCQLEREDALDPGPVKTIAEQIYTTTTERGASCQAFCLNLPLSVHGVCSNHEPAFASFFQDERT
jgi:hypothetical protein